MEISVLKNGETFSIKKNEHCMISSTYSKYGYHLPLTPRLLKYYIVI